MIRLAASRLAPPGSAIAPGMGRRAVVMSASSPTTDPSNLSGRLLIGPCGPSDPVRSRAAAIRSSSAPARPRACQSLPEPAAKARDASCGFCAMPARRHAYFAKPRACRSRAFRGPDCMSVSVATGLGLSSIGRHEEPEAFQV